MTSADPFIVFSAAAMGALFGSFFNVCIHRLPRQVSVVFPPSSCPACGGRIGPFDNIPIISWLLLAGRCRRCRASISWRYPLVEALGAAIFAQAVARLGLSWDAAQSIVLLSLLLVLLFIDAEHQLLPDAVTLGGALVGLGLAFAASAPGWAGAFTGLVAGELALLVLALAYLWVRGEEGMGEGDMKMLGMMGAFLGPARLAVALVAGALAGSAAGVVVLAGRGGAGMKARLPFGVFLAIGGAIAHLWGETIVRWYVASWVS